MGGGSVAEKMSRYWSECWDWSDRWTPRVVFEDTTWYAETQTSMSCEEWVEWFEVQRW